MATTTDPGGTTLRPARREPDDAVADAPLSRDDLFFVLKNERRRLVLRYLAGSERVVRMRDVAEQVAAWEHDITLAELTSEQRQRVYIPLYQSHLPKLDALGLVEYDQSRGVVERTDRVAQVVPYLEADEGTRGAVAADGAGVEAAEPNVGTRTRNWRDWGAYFAGATLLFAVLLAAAWAGVQPLDSVPGLTLATLITVTYAALTAGMVVLR